jgi:hypothetical protein
LPLDWPDALATPPPPAKLIKEKSTIKRIDSGFFFVFFRIIFVFPITIFLDFVYLIRYFRRNFFFILSTLDTPACQNVVRRAG